jgi:hypothetical protein
VWCRGHPGGGAIVTGVEDDGTPSKRDVANVLTLDPPRSRTRFTNTHVHFEISTSRRPEPTQVAVIEVGGLRSQSRSLSQARHGERYRAALGRSVFPSRRQGEPGTTLTFRRSIVAHRSKALWLSGVKKVAPPCRGQRW